MPTPCGARRKALPYAEAWVKAILGNPRDLGQCLVAPVEEVTLSSEEGQPAEGFHTTHLLLVLLDGSVCSLPFSGPVTLQTGRQHSNHLGHGSLGEIKRGTIVSQHKTERLQQLLSNSYEGSLPGLRSGHKPCHKKRAGGLDNGWTFREAPGKCPESTVENQTDLNKGPPPGPPWKPQFPSGPKTEPLSQPKYSQGNCLLPSHHLFSYRSDHSSPSHGSLENLWPHQQGLGDVALDRGHQTDFKSHASSQWLQAAVWCTVLRTSWYSAT